MGMFGQFRRWAVVTSLTIIVFDVYHVHSALGDNSPPSGNPSRLVLVDKGLCLPIIVPPDAPPANQRAAQELASYIEKISGVKAPVLAGNPTPIPARGIWIGYQPALKSLFPGVSFEFSHPEEILIAANANHLVIAGRDVWEPARPRMKGRRGFVEGWQDEYGTANAVYTFLQDYLNVRWLWPGETGEEVPRSSTISVTPFEYRYHPQIRLRSGMFFPSAPGDGRGISHEWMRLQRVQLDSCNQRHRLFPLTGAAFEDWWPRFHQTHPDYFALQPDGSRSYYQELGPDMIKVCHSSPAVLAQWLADVEQQLKDNPTQTEFNASPNDGYRTGHCVCEQCRAWDHPDGERLKFVWPGIIKDGPSLTDRHITFANLAADKLKQRFPGREMYVHMQAYGNWVSPPIKAIPDEHVIIQCVTSFLLMSGADRQAMIKRHQVWADVSRQILWRPNLPGRWWQGLPEVPLHQIAQDFQFVARNKCVGIFLASTWENWATQGPAYYLMAQLAWNPARDPQALLEDYYRRGFGPAAAHIKAYWSRLEEAYHRRADENRPEQEVYSPAFFKEAHALLDQADAAAGAADVLRRRVALVRAGLEYTRLLTEIRVLMDSKKKTPDPKAAEKVRGNWDQIDQICRANPATINRPFFTRTGLPMKKLNPDFVEKK